MSSRRSLATQEEIRTAVILGRSLPGPRARDGAGTVGAALGLSRPCAATDAQAIVSQGVTSCPHTTVLSSTGDLARG